MNTDPLITRYRPASWSEVVGHKAEVLALRDAVANNAAHAFLFSGKSGTGKTTLMRLVGKELGATEDQIDEIPAAVYTGVDDMRTLTAGLHYRPLNGDIRVIILDEAHRLSKQAFDSILKEIEEPPPWIFWGLCTTEPHRIPQSIKRRCLSFDLKEVSKNDLVDFLAEIAAEEGLPSIDRGVLDVCAREAKGSPGQALSNLAACTQAKDRTEAASLLRAVEEDGEGGELAKALLDGKGWEQIQPILYKLREEDAESLRYAVRGYLSKILVEVKGADRAAALATILEPFQNPFYHFADVCMAVCKVVFTQVD